MNVTFTSIQLKLENPDDYLKASKTDVSLSGVFHDFDPIDNHPHIKFDGKFLLNGIESHISCSIFFLRSQIDGLSTEEYQKNLKYILIHYVLLSQN